MWLKYALLVSFFTASMVECLELRVPGSVHVTGRLLCQGKPIRNLEVIVYDEYLAIPDIQMGTGKTDENGNFDFIASGASLVRKPDPYIRFDHICHDGGVVKEKHGMICSKIFRHMIPDHFVTEGSEPENKYDIGKFEVWQKESEIRKSAVGLDKIRKFSKCEAIEEE